jgi:hypothetical protein
MLVPPMTDRESRAKREFRYSVNPHIDQRHIILDYRYIQVQQ